VKRIALTVKSKGQGITPQELMEAQEEEGKMALLDKILAETAEAMNALEAAVYKYRDDLSEKYAAYFVEADKEKLQAMCTAMEDWLYDDGMDVDKNTYIAKHKEFTDAFAGGVGREKEAELRTDAYQELKNAIEKFSAFAASQSEDYAHISTEDKQKVAAECATAQAYLADTQAKLDALAKTEEPPIKAAEITAKASSLTSVCTPIMNTPKPLPKEPEPPPPESPAEGAAEADPAPPEGEAPPAPKPDNMDVD